jgi:hypothetical protein
MKLGLKRGDTVWAAINRYILRTQWSHSAIEVDGRIYESTALKGDQAKSGVRDYLLTPEIAAHFEWFDVGTARDSEALAAYEKIRGHGYDYLSLLSFVIPERIRDSRREYCHELSALMLGIDYQSYKTPELLLFTVLTTRPH